MNIAYIGVASLSLRLCLCILIHRIASTIHHGARNKKKKAGNHSQDGYSSMYVTCLAFRFNNRVDESYSSAQKENSLIVLAPLFCDK